MPLTEEERNLLNPLKSERPECRCLRKMMRQGEAQISELQKFISVAPEELKKKAKTPLTSMMEYHNKVNQRYVDLDCRDERIDILNKRVSLLQRLEDEGEATPKMVAEKIRYLSELQALKGGIE